MKVGDMVQILIGPFKGKVGTILEIEMNAGAINGWITVLYDGQRLLYAGEEVRPHAATRHTRGKEMTSRDFCYWLQGFLEITSEGRTNDHEQTVATEMNCRQVDSIRAHLAMVFKHEIDPSHGPPKHQAALNEIHNQLSEGSHGGHGTGALMRC